MWKTTLLLLVILAWPGDQGQAGTIVSAHCGACGYDTGELFIFGGMANFRTVCLFPAPCQARGKVVLVNLLEDNPVAHDCDGLPLTDYNNPQLYRGQGKKVVASWNLPGREGQRAVLTEADYLCPRCGAFKLRFSLAGHWD